MNSLQALFDGEKHELVPGEDFAESCVTSVVFWDFEEQDDLLPYEEPNAILDLKDVSATYPSGPMKYQVEESSWGALSIALTSLCSILGVKKKQWELRPLEERPTYWFETEEIQI